ncbi:MAG: hypothetical protein KA201_11220 [Kofleriaceae bacterium]|nr:hypothetical protein [Kofleriaceae bacterium]
MRPAVAVVLGFVAIESGGAVAQPAALKRPDASLITIVTLPAVAPGRPPRDRVEEAERWMIVGRDQGLAAAVADQARDPVAAATARRRAAEAWRAATAVELPPPSAPPHRRARALQLRMSAHAWLGDAAAAADDAAALIAACPGCPLAADAELRIGERAFAAGELDAATGAFTAAATHASAGLEVRGFAHYQLAWVAHNRGDQAAVTRHLRRTLAYTASIGARGRLMAKAATADLATLTASPSP